MWNKEQLEAINSTDGATMVVASAGAGKSSVLLERTKRMVQERCVPEDEILIISFTNAAATELKDKLKSQGLENITVGTFHSICRKLLLDAGVDGVLNLPNTYKIKREMEMQTGIKNINIDDVLSFISYQKSYMIGWVDEFKEKDCMYTDNDMRKFYKIYEKCCEQNNWFDFDDYLLVTLGMYEQGLIAKTWNYVLADEQQDANLPQYELMKVWCPSNNIFAVGDVKQSLYSWRGADPELFRNFYKEIPNAKVINMFINYRSCNNIVQRANEFIAPYNEDDPNYKDAEAFNKDDGTIETAVFEDNKCEAAAVFNKVKELVDAGEKTEDIAVLYRNNSTGDHIESELRNGKIDYYMVNSKSFFDRKEIKGIISVLRLIANSNDDEAFEFCLSEFRCYPLTFFKKDLIDKLKSISAERNCSLYEAFLDCSFDKRWESTNRDAFVDCLGRLKLQYERKLSTDKIIENAVRMFKVREMIKEKYESEFWQDKFDSIDNLISIAADHYVLDGFLKFVQIKPKKKKNKTGVALSTVHGAKGLQWKYVFLIGLEDGKFPSQYSTLDEESRIMYVGVTRATDYQWVSSIGESQFYDEYVK